MVPLIAVTTAILFLFFFRFSFAAQQPLLLPLTFSPLRNSSRTLTSDFDLRRRHHLEGSDHLAPNARMGLYDDLLSKGYYTTKLWIGTPPQEFSLIVDTGSTVTYVPCSSCKQCGHRHRDPRFQPELSSTYHPVKCNPGCRCDASNTQCTYKRSYAENSSSIGVLGEDIISFGNFSDLKPQRAVFGCENEETGDLYKQFADGIMALGRGNLSIVDQLVAKSVIDDSFSLCYGGMGVGGGAMVLSQISFPSDMVFTHSDPHRSHYYNLDLKELHVAGKKLPINPSVFDGKQGTILDSGTTYAYLPEAAFVAFKHAIMSELHSLKQVQGPYPHYNDICFSGAGRISELSKTFPAVDMVFGSGHKYSLSPENYLFKHKKVPGAYCLGFLQNKGDPTTLIGGIVVRNTLVTYDRQHSKIGFWKTNCSELWKRLPNASSPPPSSNEVSDAEISPISARLGQPYYSISREIEVGMITFDMSLGIKYSKLKPHVSELGSLIAQELGVDNSQVYLLNLSPNGNRSLTRWACYPGDSSIYFSDTTAMNIITRLAEHSVQLPETFGGYQLVAWNFQPQVKRSWWQQHCLTAVMAIIVTLMLGLSAYGIWFIWKWRQQTTQHYRPVGSDALVLEQELQPL